MMATGLASGAARKLWREAQSVETPHHEEHRFLVGEEEEHEDDLTVGQLTFHVLFVSLLMILGKMFPICCYKVRRSDS